MPDLIYRVEDSDGNGVYIGNHAMFKCCNHLKKNRPEPREDIGIERDIREGIEFCGFKSLEQVLNWFSIPELIYFERNGFKLKRVKGKISAIGKEQVLFEKIA